MALGIEDEDMNKDMEPKRLHILIHILPGDVSKCRVSGILDVDTSGEIVLCHRDWEVFFPCLKD